MDFSTLLNELTDYISRFIKISLCREFVQSIFHAYGHQNYHTSSDFKFRCRKGASGTDAFIQAYKKCDRDKFLEFIVNNSNNIKENFQKTN
ncbi:MAG: hypothetical protein ACP5C3_07215 [Methanomicrobiales archaeon]